MMTNIAQARDKKGPKRAVHGESTILLSSYVLACSCLSSTEKKSFRLVRPTFQKKRKIYFEMLLFYLDAAW